MMVTKVDRAAMMKNKDLSRVDDEQTTRAIIDLFIDIYFLDTNRIKEWQHAHS